MLPPKEDFMGWITNKLFGHTCVRCGVKRTRAKRNDLPTCSDCETALLQTKAASEDAHSCPVDGTILEKEIVHKLVIDRCPVCNGVWLDGEELEVIKKAANAAGHSSGLAVGIAIG